MKIKSRKPPVVAKPKVSDVDIHRKIQDRVNVLKLIFSQNGHECALLYGRGFLAGLEAAEQIDLGHTMMLKVGDADAMDFEFHIDGRWCSVVVMLK